MLSKVKCPAILALLNIHDSQQAGSGSDEEKLNRIINHMDRLIDLKGEKVALLEMRGHAAWYVKGMKGATFVRRELSNVSTRKDLVNIIEKYREYQKEGPI